MFKKLKKLLLQLHRWTGMAMSFLFVVWFISGFILIYHSFPKPRPQHYYHGLSVFSAHDSIQIPYTLYKKHKVNSIVLEKVNDKTVFRFNKRGTPVYDAVTLHVIEPLSVKESVKLVSANFSGSVLKVKELNDFDQWIPWAYYKAYFPIHKFWIDDDRGTQVYVSSVTGRIVQETSTKSRTMAWLGAIPHWMYFKQLRLNAALWSDVVICLSTVGSLVCLSGIIVGFIRLQKRRGGAKWNAISPYRKKWFRWHHITGFVFGFFVFTFILSGLMSLADVPRWMVKKEKETNYYQLWNGSAFNSQQQLQGFNAIIQQKSASSIKRIVCRKVMERTFYEVNTQACDQSEYYIVEEDQIKPLPPVSQLAIERRIKALLPQKQYSIQLLPEYKHYYSAGRKGINPLPAYEITLYDAYGTVLYINLQTGELLKVLNRSSKWQWWLYQGLHTFNFGWFRQLEWLRQAWLIILSIGGTSVSVSALVLGIRYIKRRIKR